MSEHDEAVRPRTSPIHDVHMENGGQMVAYAGWSLPVRFPSGIIAEHNWCRTKAVLFDVSHMGQVRLSGPDLAAALEALVPGNIVGLAPGKARYTMFTNDTGGVLDDIIVSNLGDALFVVVNGARREADLAHLRRHLEPGIAVEEFTDRGLLAFQGPAAGAVLADLAPPSAELRFMETAEMELAGARCRVSRMGYTGEDGFEISVHRDAAPDVARALLASDDVCPAGLGARDSLRLEAGLCLYGQDIDETTTPIEAQLQWSIAKRRRAEGGFPGAEIICRQLADRPERLLVGIKPEGRAPAREQTPIQDTAGNRIGVVTSGVFGPTVDGPVAMGYVEAGFAEPGTEIALLVRDKPRPATVVKPPFCPHRYKH
ncbi:MAG: glycine cleavage system aminomethyltransferase GcvT [Methyloligellaceae bacterium]